MNHNSYKYLIVGAGLSGLTTAFQLQLAGETDFLILESRDRIGGRIITKNGIDFGATWFHNHHTHVVDLVENLGLTKFHQFDRGKSVLVYNSMAPAHYFENDPTTPSAFRIAGGSSRLIEKLAEPIKAKIHLHQPVTQVIESDNKLSVKTNENVYEARKVVMTIPPRIANRVIFDPILPNQCIEAMESTHTWMSNAIKIGLTFKTPFWRQKEMSGMLIGQIGPVVELYDHVNFEENTFALMGFVNEALRDLSTKERKTKILGYLEKYLGSEVLNHELYEEKDWSKDNHTSCNSIKSIYMSPGYGNKAFDTAYLNGKLYFSGAETSVVHGGYMDGAIRSGLITANKIMDADLP